MQRKSHSWKLLLLSAETEGSLEATTSKLIKRLKEDAAPNFSDLVYTLQVGENSFRHRRMLVCQNASDAASALSSRDEKRVFTARLLENEPSVAFLFPGQGAQHLDMGRALYETEPTFREDVDRCCEILKPRLGTDLQRVIYPSANQMVEAAQKLTQVLFAQPSLFVIEYALAQLWMRWGVHPKAMLGHSVGEYVAACLAGVFSLNDALSLVAARAELVQKQPGGAMLVVRLPEDKLRDLLNNNLTLAAVNAPSLCVVAGSFGAIEALEKALKKLEVAHRRLHASHAFHSEMMEPILKSFAAEFVNVKMHPPKTPFVSNVTGKWITVKEATDPAYWVAQLRRAVLFAEGLAELAQGDSHILLEVGPGQTLYSLARQHPLIGQQHSVLCSLSHVRDQPHDAALMLETLGRLWLAGAPIDWRRFSSHECHQLLPLDIESREEDSPVAPETERRSKPVPVDILSSHANKTLLELRSIFERLSDGKLSHMNASLTFLDLGLDSLFLAQASHSIQKQFGIYVTFRQLFEELSTLDKLAERIDREKAFSPHSNKSFSRENFSIQPEHEGKVHTLPLTEAQREMWFSAQMGPAVSAAYNESHTLRLQGKLQVNALRLAVQQLIDRHEALRTTFPGEFQHIAANAATEVRLIDLADLEEKEGAPRAQEIIKHEIQKPFDLNQAPLLRVHILRLAENHHLLVFIIHHLVCDGWSMGVLLHELGEFYAANCRGAECALPPAPLFSAYARRLAILAKQSEKIESAEAYWLEQFSDSIPILELPTDRLRPSKRTYAGSRRTRLLNPTRTAEIKRFSSERCCTMFTTLFAAFNALLHRWSRQDDLVIGVPAAAQVIQGERVVGHCSNLLPVRSRVQPHEKFGSYLSALRQTVFDAFDHYDYPLGALLRKLNLPQDPNRVPLVSLTFNVNRLSMLNFGELETRTAVNSKSFVNFDINFNVTENDGQLWVDCCYSAELFDDATIDRMLGWYENLLQRIVAGPDQRIGDLPLLSDAEQEQLLIHWNQTAAKYPSHLCVHQLFEQQAERTPGEIAVIFENSRLTYLELNQRADRLAQSLRGLGVGPETPVALGLQRSLEMIVATLAVLKSGAPYLPLDPAYPRERIQFMLQDARASVLLTQGSLLKQFTFENQNFKRICLDRFPFESPWENGPDSIDIPEGSRANPDSPAYIIYTSGSTGKPKGITMPHRALTNLIWWQIQRSRLKPGSRTLQFSSLSFDVSFQEIFATLCGGGALVLIDEELRRNPTALWDLIAREKVERLFLPFVALQQLASVFDVAAAQSVRLREIITAGEQLQITPKITALFEALKDCALHNQYGPSESHVVAEFTLDGPPRDWKSLPPIGRPIANAEIYLLDGRQPAPIGAPGELCVGGACLARGYLNRPELTAEKFIAHPFDANPSARLYRTGDSARWLADGNLEFLGRLDHQVKVRGYRIELGEIENALAQHPFVRACAAAVHPDALGEKRLVAYIVAKPNAASPASVLQDYLKNKLPAYMTPSVFLQLESLPLTPSGKVDRKALPAPGIFRCDPGQTYAAPSTTTEEVLCAIWSGVLGLERIGVHDSFFELGGHSLLVMQTLSRVRKAFDVDLPLRLFFEAPTVSELAVAIDDLLMREISAMDGQGMKDLAKISRETAKSKTLDKELK